MKEIYFILPNEWMIVRQVQYLSNAGYQVMMMVDKTP